MITSLNAPKHVLKSKAKAMCSAKLSVLRTKTENLLIAIANATGTKNIKKKFKTPEADHSWIHKNLKNLKNGIHDANKNKHSMCRDS